MHSCVKDAGMPHTPTSDNSQLLIKTEFDLNIKEPSGLSLSWDANELMVVSDHSNTVFRINKSGKTIQELAFSATDLEGVTYQKANETIWLVDEQKNKLYQLNKQGDKIAEHLLEYQDHPSNKGLEGITINTTNNHLFMLNEASPGLLLEFFNGQIINSTSLSFAPDYSGIFYEETEDKLWIISDEAKSIYKCDLKGNLLHTYDHTIDKAEGIVVIENNIWLVSDSQNKLYKLEIEKK